MPNQNISGKKIVIILAFRDFRDVEYFVPKEILETAGAEIKTASNSESAKSADEGGEEDLSSSTKMGRAIGADGGEVEIDLLVKDLNPANFDAIVFIGGPGALEYLENRTAWRIANEAVEKNKVLAAICIAPEILAKAGVLKGKKATVWSSSLDQEEIKALEEAGALYSNENVVIDGKIVTANGPMSAKKFAQEIIKLLGN